MGWINPSRALRLNEGYRCYCMTDISMQSFQKKKKKEKVKDVIRQFSVIILTIIYWILIYIIFM